MRWLINIKWSTCHVTIPSCVFIFTCLSSCIVHPSWAKLSIGLVGYPPTFDDIWSARHSGRVAIGYCCSFDGDWWHFPRPHRRRFLGIPCGRPAGVTSTALPIKNGLVHSSKIQWGSGGYRRRRKGTTRHIIYHELRLAHILSDVLWWSVWKLSKEMERQEASIIAVAKIRSGIFSCQLCDGNHGENRKNMPQNLAR